MGCVQSKKMHKNTNRSFIADSSRRVVHNQEDSFFNKNYPLPMPNYQPTHPQEFYNHLHPSPIQPPIHQSPYAHHVQPPNQPFNTPPFYSPP